MATKVKEMAEAKEKSPSEQAVEKQLERPEKAAGPSPLFRAVSAPQPPPGSKRPADELLTDAKPSLGVPSRARAMTALQKSVGNTRVSHMLRPVVQTKLAVGAPHDIYEQEADHIADSIMQMPELQRPDREDAGTYSVISEQEPSAPNVPLRRQLVGEEKIGTMPQTSQNGEVTPEVESYLNASRGGGQPLSESVRAFMEPRFGQEFGGVRVHTGTGAARAARDLNAQAFTSGQDIYFGGDRYQPQTPEGNRVLAHELVHTVQQSGTPTVRRIPTEPGWREATITVRWTDDDVDFYHRVINAIAGSKSFRSVEKAALWQPFHDPIFRLFRRLGRGSLAPKKGERIELRASAWFDPTVFHGQVTNASVETEQATRLQETKILGLLTPRETFSDRSPTEIGPGGIVDLSFSATPAVTAASLGGLKWILASGSGTVKGDNDGQGVFTATSSGSVFLELRTVSGFSAGKVVSSHRLTILAVEDMVSRDPNQPERLTVKREGLTPELLAEHLYGDKSKATAIWAVWDEKARGGPWTVATKIPVGIWIGFEYRYLKPEWKKVFDASLDVKSRTEWGAKPPILGDPNRSYEPYKGPLENILDSIVIHHAGNEGYKTMSEVQDLHMGKKKGADIGYHYGISLKGGVFEGRPIDVKGTHVEGANTGRIGIVLLADLDPENEGLKFYEKWGESDEDPLSPEMEASLLRLIHFLKGKYPKIKYLGGHDEFDKRRFCPGKKAMDKMDAWRSDTYLWPPP